jgi:hypothetical protein
MLDIPFTFRRGPFMAILEVPFMVRRGPFYISGEKGRGSFHIQAGTFHMQYLQARIEEIHPGAGLSYICR